MSFHAKPIFKQSKDLKFLIKSTINFNIKNIKIIMANYYLHNYLFKFER